MWPRRTQLDSLERVFGSARLVILEDGSTDDTAGRLRVWAEHDPRVTILSPAPSNQLQTKERRISDCRNRVMRAALDLGVDYVAVADLDEATQNLDEQQLRACFNLRVPWAGCMANNAGLYYDTYALRTLDEWMPGDPARCADTHGVRACGLLERGAFLHHDAPPVEVVSAFSGLALYKAPFLHDCSYASTRRDGHTVCEHVPFHECMRSRGARLWIAPAMIPGGELCRDGLCLPCDMYQVQHHDRCHSSSIGDFQMSGAQTASTAAAASASTSVTDPLP